MRRSVWGVVPVGLAIAALFIWSPWRSQPSKKDDPVASASAPSSAAPQGRHRTRTGHDAPLPTSSANSPGSNRVVFEAPWGGGSLDQLGHEHPEEGNPIGPMSLAVDGKGRVFVLDEINGRVVRRGADGKPDKEVKLDTQTPEDLVVADDGSMAVLDRHSGQAVTVYGDDGSIKGALPLTGSEIDDPGLVTGVFSDGSDIYAEKEHGQLVKLGNTSGVAAVPQTTIPGRPSRDGLSFLNAGITDAESGRAWVSAIDRATSQNRFTRELRLRGVIHSIVLLDSDKSGTIYFAAEIQEPGAPPEVQLACLEPTHGEILGGAVLQASAMPDETFRDFVVQDEGGVIYAVRTPKGVTYYEADCS
jgi:hypothetical protein